VKRHEQAVELQRRIVIMEIESRAMTLLKEALKRSEEQVTMERNQLLELKA